MVASGLVGVMVTGTLRRAVSQTRPWRLLPLFSVVQAAPGGLRTSTIDRGHNCFR
jgi:hypothetical protein